MIFEHVQKLKLHFTSLLPSSCSYNHLGFLFYIYPLSWLNANLKILFHSMDNMKYNMIYHT